MCVRIFIKLSFVADFNPAPSKPGDQLVLRCLRDVVAAVSSCPMDLSPINGGRITPLKLVVGDSPELAQIDESAGAPAETRRPMEPRSTPRRSERRDLRRARRASAPRRAIGANRLMVLHLIAIKELRQAPTPTISVGQASQVNVANQQVNAVGKG